MRNVFTKQWAYAALVRAIKTGAQTMVTLIGTQAVSVTSLDWPQMAGIVATTMVLSVATSLAGLPEVEGDEE